VTTSLPPVCEFREHAADPTVILQAVPESCHRLRFCAGWQQKGLALKPMLCAVLAAFSTTRMTAAVWMPLPG
jgi:hypothetical protein